MLKSFALSGALASVAASAPSPAAMINAAHESSLQTVREIWQANSRHFAATLDRARTRSLLQLENTPEQLEACRVSFEAFGSALTSCSAISEVFEGTPSDVGAIVSTHCAAGGCDEQVKAAISDLKEKCVDTEILRNGCASKTEAECVADEACFMSSATTCTSDPAFWDQLRLYVEIPCMKGATSAGGEEYCVPSFYDFINPDTSVLLQTRLENGCDACTVKMLKAFGEVQPFEAALHFLNLQSMCIKLDDKFCAVHFQELEAQPKNNCGLALSEQRCTENGDGCLWNDNKCEEFFSPAKLDMSCHPCTFAFFQRHALILAAQARLGGFNNDAKINDIKAVIIMSKGLCITDLQNEYCMPQSQTSLQSKDFEGAKICTSVSDYQSDVGCCAGTLVNIMKANCEVQKLRDPVEAINSCAEIAQVEGMIAACDADIGDGCVQTKLKLKGSLVLRNIKKSYWEAHKAEIRALVLKMIAYNAAVDVNDILELSVAADSPQARRLLADDEIAVKYSVEAISDKEAKAISQGADGDLDPFELQSLPVDALIDPLKGISVSGGVAAEPTSEPTSELNSAPSCKSVGVAAGAVALAGSLLA